MKVKTDHWSETTGCETGWSETLQGERRFKMADKKQAKEEKIVVAKNAAELQKIRLEKLMKNPVIMIFTQKMFVFTFINL